MCMARLRLAGCHYDDVLDDVVAAAAAADELLSCERDAKEFVMAE